MHVVVGNEFVAFESIGRETLLRIQVSESEVYFDLLGVYVEDFFVKRNRLGGESVGRQDIRSPI